MHKSEAEIKLLTELSFKAFELALFLEGGVGYVSQAALYNPDEVPEEVAELSY